MLHQYRFVFVVALLGVAAWLATERGRLPLVLRGLRKTLRRDVDGTRRGAAASEPSAAVPVWKRMAAFALVVVAFFVAVCL